MNTKEQVKKALIDVYESYKSRGLEAIYLYGSILTDDFNEATSDIDSIGIVKDPLLVEEEDKIKELLKKENPTIKNFGFRFLYTSELDGGPIKGTLAKFIHPSILLLGFPNWEHIVGRKFNRQDFSLRDIDFKKAIQLEIESNIIGEGWRNVSQISTKKQMYFLKTLAWIIYFSQRDRGLNFPFSYKKVFENAQDEKEIMEAILSIKEKEWDTNLFKEKLSLFQSFIDRLDYKDLV